jgi:hypothetical protein
MKWWSMPARTAEQRAVRQAAKLADEQERPVLPAYGQIAEITKGDVTGFQNWIPGGFWPYSGRAEKRIARLFAESALVPSPLLTVSVIRVGP